jgi:hypothetical protein
VGMNAGDAGKNKINFEYGNVFFEKVYISFVNFIIYPLRYLV